MTVRTDSMSVDITQDPGLGYLRGAEIDTMLKAQANGLIKEKIVLNEVTEVKHVYVNNQFTPGSGNPGEVQFQGNGSITSDPQFTYNANTDQLEIDGNILVNAIYANNYFFSNNQSLSNVFGNVLHSSGNILANGNITANYLFGDGSGLTHIAGANVTGSVPHADSASTANGVPASGVVGTVANAYYATTAGSVAANNVTGLGNIATINKDGSNTHVLYGNGVFAALPTPPATYGDSNVSSYLPTYSGDISPTNVHATTNTLLGDNSTSGAYYVYRDSNQVSLGQIGVQTINVNGNGIQLAGINGVKIEGAANANVTIGGGTTGNVNVPNGIVFNDGSHQTTAWTGTVDSANVTGLGDLAAINKDGSSSNVLYGNGVFAAPPSTQPPSYGNSNVTSLLSNLGSNSISTTTDITAGGLFLGNTTLAQISTNGNLFINANVDGMSPQWGFFEDGNFKLPLNNVAIQFGNGAPISTTTSTANRLVLRDSNGNIFANNLGNIASINLNGSSSNVLYGNGVFAPASGGTPAGSNTYVQFNDNGSLGGSGGLVYDKTTGNLTVNGGFVNAAAVVTTGRIEAGTSITASGNITGANFNGPLANGTSNVAIATAAGNVVTTVGNAAILTVYSGGIKVAGSGVLQSPGGASSITLNNNGANIPTANITTFANITGTGNALNVVNSANIGGNLTVTGNITANNLSGSNLVINGQAVGYGVTTPTIGSNTSPVTGTITASTVGTATTIMTVAIPSAGTWQIVAQVNASMTAGQECVFVLYDGTGTLVANSETRAGYIGGASLQAQGCSLWTVTTVGAVNYTVRAFAPGATANCTITSAGDGRTNVTWTLMNTPVTLNGMTVPSNISVTGNVYANNFQGTQPNVSLIAGAYTYTFDNTGILNLPTVGGDEGGQLNLGAAATNTTLTGPISVDIYRDKIRFFEGSANAKGVFLDLAKAPSSVGGELQVKASGLVNAGVDVQLGYLKARIPTTGNRSLQLSTTSGSYNVYGSDVYYSSGVGGSTINGSSPLSITTTPTYLNASLNFGQAGSTDTWTIMDTSNTISWRITLVVGVGFNNNMISIERLV